MKNAGKQIRRSLKTDDRKLAERRLADFKRKIDRIQPEVHVKRTPGEFNEAADLPAFNHHSFRHYFVSNAIEKGIGFKVIDALLKVYARHQPSYQIVVT